MLPHKPPSLLVMTIGASRLRRAELVSVVVKVAPFATKPAPLCHKGCAEVTVARQHYQGRLYVAEKVEVSATKRAPLCHKG